MQHGTACAWGSLLTLSKKHNKREGVSVFWDKRGRNVRAKISINVFFPGKDKGNWISLGRGTRILGHRRKGQWGYGGGWLHWRHLCHVLKWFLSNNLLIWKSSAEWTSEFREGLRGKRTPQRTPSILAGIQWDQTPAPTLPDPFSKSQTFLDLVYVKVKEVILFGTCRCNLVDEGRIFLILNFHKPPKDLFLVKREVSLEMEILAVNKPICRTETCPLEHLWVSEKA